MSNTKEEIRGDGAAFDANWRSRPETGYLHWTRAAPANQIQLAFRRHWITFNRFLDDDLGSNRSPGRCLEVGCGRGSLSAYFSDAGWDCTLLDLSEAAIERAQSAFGEAELDAQFDVGDCLALPYPDESFDLVFSIGLLEHFEDIEAVIAEQARILAPGGMFIGYVVPHLPDCVQKEHEWVNHVLRALLPEATQEAAAGKVEVYRSDELSPRYLEAMSKSGLQHGRAAGAYPLPLVSHSPNFPFSLLPEPAETALVAHFEAVLAHREAATGSDPWLCEEGYGQAFIVYGTKR